ncbi:MAG: aminotransferase class I/II-fold pyridoxal phosphate-dependent enzyme, partial [Treponema sp.]|nr:aminotransferase class I/II-fold pyridoxal phosphate-dependent enzyme [Treponema sp.]
MNENEFNELVKSNRELSPDELRSLEPYKVDSAIIMSAGISSRCLPFSKIIPKGLFEIKGEVLLERQIKQLQSAGIDRIVLVVGYMKEKFYYLKDKFGITLVDNDDFIERNNNYSLFLAQKYLKNSYICCSDIYYPENVFSRYEYDSYFACKYSEKFIDEYCITGTKNNYITKIDHGGKECWYTMGHVYFNRAVSEKLIEMLNIERDYPEVKTMIFDDFHIRHINKLPARIKEYKDGDILEFDTLQDAIDFDGDFRQFMIDNSVKNWVDEYSGIIRYNTTPTEQKTGRLHLNENLYLPTPRCQDILREITLEEISTYDARGTDILETEISKDLGLPVQNIFIHNGSSDVIRTILNLAVKKEHTVLVPNLAWDYYKAVVSLKFAKCITYNIAEKDDTFCHDIDDILAKAKKYSPKVIIITTPNNPTGNSIADADLEKIVSENPNSLILVDEAYWGFSDYGFDYKRYLATHKNVVFSRTFSKFYGLAGIRIGFGICSEVAKELIDLDLPFRTSIIGRKLGIVVLQDTAYYSSFKSAIIQTRNWFIDEVNKIKGFKAFRSDSNFVFVKISDYDFKEVKSWFDNSGLLVKLVSVGNLHGLRITVGPH